MKFKLLSYLIAKIGDLSAGINRTDISIEQIEKIETEIKNTLSELLKIKASLQALPHYAVLIRSGCKLCETKIDLKIYSEAFPLENDSCFENAERFLVGILRDNLQGRIFWKKNIFKDRFRFIKNEWLRHLKSNKVKSEDMISLLLDLRKEYYNGGSARCLLMIDLAVSILIRSIKKNKGDNR